jgi:serine/threonine protein kinase
VARGGAGDGRCADGAEGGARSGDYSSGHQAGEPDADKRGRGEAGGLARAVYGPADAEITIPGAFVGSPSYASPEQVAGGAAGRVDARSDLYSLAATGYALVTGQPPFVDDDPSEIMRKQVEEEFPDPREMAEVPAEFVEILKKASAKKPAARFTGAEKMHEAVTRLLAFSGAEKVAAAPARKVVPRVNGATESVAELEMRLTAARSSHDETSELTALRSLVGLYTQLDHVKLNAPRRAG